MLRWLASATSCLARSPPLTPETLIKQGIRIDNTVLTFSGDTLSAPNPALSGFVFEVRDHGPGIARDQMRRIFELFYRTESELTRETAGTGIGLALVRGLADAMDAKVTVENADPGARFSVSFAPASSG